MTPAAHAFALKQIHRTVSLPLYTMPASESMYSNAPQSLPTPAGGDGGAGGASQSEVFELRSKLSVAEQALVTLKSAYDALLGRVQALEAASGMSS
jgi:hypothetical protein